MQKLVLECPIGRKNEGGVSVAVVLPCHAGDPPPPDFASDTDFKLDLTIVNW